MSLVTDAVGALLCLITLMAELVAKGIVIVINLVLDGVAVAAAGVVQVMPSMPAWPVTGLTWTWLNFFLPVSGLVALFSTGVAFVVAWFGVRIVLNWARAL